MGGGVEPQSFSTSPTIEIDTPVSANREAPPVDSFSLEGLETTSLSTDAPAAAAPPAAPPPPPPAPVASAPAEGLVDLDISIPSSAPEPVAPPPAAAAPVADAVELDFAAPTPPPAAAEAAPAEAIDLDFAPPAATASAPSPAPAPEPVEAAAPSDDLPLLDLGSSDIPTAPAPVSTAQTPAPEPAAEVIDFIPPAAEPPPEPPKPAPVAPAAPAPVAATADASSAFVTETMAELYLKQGHKDEALRVYRALLEKRPGDAGLLAKIASLQPPPVRTGPTIREMLHVIALRRPGYHPAPPTNGNGTAAHAAAVGPDALAHLFGNAAVSPEDDAAAVALFTAYAEQNGHDAILSGTPAHPASNDLSLNTVFSAENPAPAPPPSNFSFDQFFSQRATAEHDAQPGGEEPTESKEDVAQFSQWLEGLKQK